MKMTITNPHDNS